MLLFEILIPDLESLPAHARALSAQITDPVVCFRGGMGHGKTTIIKALCQALGVIDPVTSPTFSLINEYLRTDGRRVFHIDLYRVETPAEALDLGLEDVLATPSALSLIEWPEVAEPLLPTPRLEIEVEVLHDGARLLRGERKLA